MFTENSFWRRKLKYGTYARARGAVRHAGQISPTSSADHRQGARARCAADAARALCAPNRGRRFVMAITSVRVASGGDGRAPQAASLCRIGPTGEPIGSLLAASMGLAPASARLSEGFAARGANLQEISKEIQAWLQDCHTAAG